MHLNERSIGDVTIIDISGRITIQDGADVFRDAIRELVRQDRVNVVVNFRDGTYIDSTALGELIRAYVSLTRKGGTMKLLSVGERVHQLLMLTKLLSVFDLFDDEAEAVRSFGVARNP
jgi:anti-sigma B factor antagonist